MDINSIQRNRLIFFLVFSFFLIVILICRLYYLQITEGKEYEKKAVNNRIKIIRTPAPRGTILDRNGKAFAENKKSYIVNVIPEELEKDPQALQLLCNILDINAGIYNDILKEAKPRPGYPVRIASDISMDKVIKIGEYRSYLKGVSVEDTYLRYYPLKDRSCHITGYTREITKEALDRARDMGLDYRMGDYVGIAGLEKEYEKYLKGRDGGKKLMVNARGEVVSILKDMPHIQGQTLKTSLDANVQTAAYNMLKGKTGAAVAIDPGNGEIIALVSSPAYDPNIFVKGLKASDWRKLSRNRKHPLQNRFAASFYPPGSVFKPIIGFSLLENHLGGNGIWADCPGYFRLGSYRKGCWAVHHGVNFSEAIAQSCDVWFYKESLELGIDRLYNTATAFGLGKPTGIDLPEEAVYRGKSGNFPSREWHEKIYKRKWSKGDTLNVSIGQGDVQVSPLQMALAISAIANGGTLYEPHIMREIVNPQTGETIKYEPKSAVIEGNANNFAIVRDAMEGCVKHGTGKGCAVKGIRVGGKTGSAQATGGVAHGWFVAFAPAENPKIAVAAIVEHGGSGSASAAPVCKAMIEAYLKQNK